MMNNDNSITVETALFGFIAEEAHSNRFSTTVNKLFKSKGINAMVIPMNIRPDDLTFTVSQMRHSKLNGALIAPEYQEEVYALLDHATPACVERGVCDLILVENAQLAGDYIIDRALNAYAEAFDDEIAMNALCYYFYELVTGEKYESA